MRTVSVVLLTVAIATVVAHAQGGNHTMNRRAKRDLLVRSKRRWVLSTIEIVEGDLGPFPKEATQMFNDRKQKGNDNNRFRISGHGVTEEPLGVFSIDELTGIVYVHKTIDREKYPDFHISFDIFDKDTKESVDRTLSFDVDVKDINDNAPVFERPTISAKVKENSPEGPVEVVLIARDSDEPNSENSTVTMRVVSQVPAEPKISVVNVQGTYLNQLIFSGCFNYDKAKVMKVIIEAKDQGKPSLSSSATVTLNVLDSNTHLPVFKDATYSGEVMEMESGKVIVRVGVTDADTPNTPAWRAKYFFVKGNEEGNYKIETDPKTNEGILTVIKGRDFEKTRFTGLEIGVENEEPLFVCGAGEPGAAGRTPKVPPPKSVNITIKVIDVNDPPVFEKEVATIYVREEEEAGRVLYSPVVTDEDSDVELIRYKLIDDPAGWFTIDEKTGKVTQAETMDRESPFVDKNDIYTIRMVAMDNGEPPATSTGTVLVSVGDVNDHLPHLLNYSLVLCGNKADRVVVMADDEDKPPYEGPFSFFLADDDEKTLSKRWKLDPATGTEAGLISLNSLAYENYTVPLVIQDQQGMAAFESVVVVICDCGDGDECRGRLPASASMGAAGIGLLFSGLLILLLPLLCCFFCNCGEKTFQHIVYEDEGNQTLIKYNEEGGGSACKAEPTLILTPTNNIVTKNIVTTEVKQTAAPPMIPLPTDEVDGVFRSSETYMITTQESNEMSRRSGRTMNQTTNQMTSTGGFQSGGFQSGGYQSGTYQSGGYQSGTYQPGGFQRSGEANGTMRNQFSWNTNRMNHTIRNGSASFPRSFGLMSDRNIADHIDRRLYMIEGDQDYPVYQPYEYRHEGQGSKSHSLDELSFSDRGDELDFLDDLGSKFSTLGGICLQAMGEGDDSSLDG